MKNLKKSLALVLAIALVFSLVVFANAEFTDADQINPKFTDAVGVMNGLGIIKGYDTGAFGPQDTLTRDQGAKIITMIKMGKASSTLPTNQVFNDVPADNWAAPFVAYANSKNIINGYGDGNFGPGDKLSGYAFGKMLFVSLGYGQNKEFTGDNWKIAVAEVASETGLFAGLEDYLSDDPLPREVAAQLAFNALGTPMVQYLKSDDVYEAITPTKTLAESVQDLNMTPVPGATDAAGRPTKTYTNLAGTKVIYEATAEPIAVITDGSFDPAKYAAQKKWDYSKLVDGYWNNDDGYDETDFSGYPGATVEFYGYPDAKTGVVYITNIVGTYDNFATMGKVDATKKEATFYWEGNPAYDDTVKEADYPETYKMLAELAEGDAFIFVENFDSGEYMLSIEKATAVEGSKITAVDAAKGTFTMGGTKYTVAYAYDGPAIALGAVDGTFYTDADGYVIGFVGTPAAPVAKEYVFAVKTYDKTSGGGYDEYGDPIPSVTTYFVQCVNEAGEVVELQTADSSYGGASPKYCYEVTKKYDATLKTEVAEFDASTCDYATAETLTAASVKTSKGDYFTKDVKFVFVKGEGAAIKVTVKEGVQAITAMDIYYPYAKVEGGYKVATVFVDGAPATPPTLPTGVAFVFGDTPSATSALVTDGTGKEVTGYAKSIYVDGVKKDIYVDAAAPISDGYYEVKENGELTVLTPYTNAAYITPETVTKNIMGLLSTTSVTDKATEGATFVNMTGNPALTDASKLEAGTNDVALVLDAKGNISIIYVVA